MEVKVVFSFPFSYSAKYCFAGENVDVARFMLEYYGPDSRTVFTGPSTHNQV